WQPMLTSGDNRENREESTTGWAVHDGVLICTSDEDGFLIHEGTYSDFELQLEFKLVPNGNSGVYFRAELEGNAARAGMEAQIIDSNYEHPRIPNYQLTDDTRTGSIYAVTGPGKSPLNKLGEWNSLTLRAVGDEVQVSVNGIQTAQANMSLNESLKSRPRSGRIYLSNWKGEANEMAFRNIRIKELTPHPTVEIEKKLPEKNLALYFDGVDDHVVTPIKYDGSHPITIEAWVAPVHPWNDRIIIGNCWGDNGLRINHATNGRNQPMWECEILQSSFTPSPHHYIHATPGSIRTHLAYVWDGQESRFYINGDASDPKLHAPLVEFPDGEMSFHIGVPPSEKKSDYWRFHGYVDEIRFSNVARYDSTFIPPERHRSDNETIALYHCDDEAANLILKDASGNGNDAEIFGATRKPNYEMHMPSDYYSHLNEYEQATHKVMPTRKGPALRFTTSGAKVEIPAVDFDFAEPFTAEFWGTPESEWHSRYEWGRIGYRLGKTNIRLSFPEYRWRLRVWNGPAVNNEVSRTHTARLDTRIHFAMQWNGEHLELFINGHPVPGPEITDAASFPSLKDWLTVTLKLANGESSFLGSWEGDAQFGGEIDSFRLSRGARYQQADQPEEQPVPFKPQELIVDEQTLILYDFHEGEGNVLHDLSGNDYHGTITPETIWVPAPPEVKMLPGLVAEPPDEENILRTQVITRWPQAEPCHHTFSPDGKLYAIGSRDGLVRLFEGGPEGELKSVIHIRKPDNYGAFGMHWAADSKMFFTATYDWIQIWSIEGKLLHEWQARLTDIEWHSRENILGGSDRSFAYHWTPAGKELLKVETWGSDRGSRFVWSPEGDRFLTVNGNVVLLWSRTGEIIKQIPIDFTIFECEWSPDGERIVIITDDKQIVMMSPEGELLKRSQFESYGPLDVCWAPDSQSFAVSDRDYVSVWDRKANRVTRYQSVQFKSTYNCFCFSPNGQQHLILKIDKSIRIHDTNSGQLIKRLHEEVPLLTSVDWNQNNKLLMVANHTHEYPVGLFNEEGTRQTEFIKLNKPGYNAAWNTATDEVVLGADWELWRINTGNSENQRLGSADKLTWAEFGYRRIAVHPAGTFIAGTGMNNPVRILNSKGELIKELKLGREIFSMKFSPDGQWLAINTSGAGITIYDTAAWNKYCEIKESSMYGVDWSSDSSKIITTISRGSIKIFNLEGLLQQEFEPDWRVGRDQSYTALSWSPDDRWIVSSRDIDVQAYNLETKERRQFPLHNGIVRDAVWISPAEFVTAADDGTLSCWDVESGKRRWITVTLWNRQNELKTVTLSATGEVLQIDPGVETMLVDLTETETGQFKIAPFKSPSSQIVE
ncbi:MAG TPA: hypothetical protein DIW81_26390, partial [Planctomycetaceae bacterium]|nr:hypothetical protein [Planctomycetaceae bacterium]